MDCSLMPQPGAVGRLGENRKVMVSGMLRHLLSP
jgi:hypothetical protein